MMSTGSFPTDQVDAGHAIASATGKSHGSEKIYAPGTLGADAGFRDQLRSIRKNSVKNVKKPTSWAKGGGGVIPSGTDLGNPILICVQLGRCV